MELCAKNPWSYLAEELYRLLVRPDDRFSACVAASEMELNGSHAAGIRIGAEHDLIGVDLFSAYLSLEVGVGRHGFGVAIWQPYNGFSHHHQFVVFGFCSEVFFRRSCSLAALEHGLPG